MLAAFYVGTVFLGCQGGTGDCDLAFLSGSLASCAAFFVCWAAFILTRLRRIRKGERGQE